MKNCKFCRCGDRKTVAYAEERPYTALLIVRPTHAPPPLRLSINAA